MPANGYQTGLVVIDDYTHAVRRRLLRRVALCGAGPIVVHRDEAFDPYAMLACPACREAVGTRGRSAPEE
jgi:hypothetical protein